jgi:Dolichyl-phosphate-mannose-protein mannosyltransferase
MSTAAVPAKQPFAASVSKAEYLFAALILLALVALRCRYVFAARFDTDEPQHLHVVWGWATGLLPYRDFFDNHVPLFHLLFAPLVRLFGERADLLIPMRFAMAPLWLGSMWAIYLLGARAFSARAGLWSMLLAASSPRFFFKMGEFRTDVLWTLLWFAALAVLLQEKPGIRRFFCAGLLLGAALAVSMKTSIMLAALAFAGANLFLILWPQRRAVSWKEIACRLGALGLGFLLVPALVLAFFAEQGLLHTMYRCVIEHNRVPGTSLAPSGVYLVLIFAVSGGAVLAAWLCTKLAADSATGLRRAALILVTAVYYLIIRFVWPIVTAQDYTPLDPLFFVCLAPVLLLLGNWLARRLPKLPVRFAPLIALFLFGLAQWRAYSSPFQNGTHGEIAMVADVLKLTAPGEIIMDAKGETLFRPRAFYYVLETLTIKRMSLGLLEDDAVSKIITARVPLIHGPLKLPERDVQWERANYLSVGRVEMLGVLLPPAVAGVRTFTIAVPQRYTLLADRGTVAGTLDGTPFTGSRELAAGPHEFRPSAEQSGQRFAVLWATAVERGYTPFGGANPRD